MHSELLQALETLASSGAVNVDIDSSDPKASTVRESFARGSATLRVSSRNLRPQCWQQ